MAIEPLSRRSVLWGVAVAGCGAVAGFALARTRLGSAPGPATAANGYGPAVSTGRLLAQLNRIPPGSGLVLEQAKVVLTRDSADAVKAFSAVCTHQGCTVASVANGVITCPCHGSQFDAQSGAVIGGPAPRGLSAIPVVVRDGEVYTT